MQRINHLILLGIAVMLVSCSSQQQQQSPPSSAPPSSAPPSSAPPSSAPPASAPSTPTQSPSETSSPPSSPDQGETGAPSMPSPGTPGPSAGNTGPQGSSTPESRSSEKNRGKESSSEDERREAAETLKKAGQQIADAAKNGAAGAQNGQSASDSVDDPFIPDGDQDSDDYSEGTLAGTSMPTMSPSGQSTDGSMNSGEPSGKGDMSGAEMSDGAASDGNGGMTPEQQAAVEAAQEALEQAGIALQTAGVTLEGATTDGELAAAEADLSKARLSVIIAGQDLLDLRKIFEGTVNEDIFADAEESLNDANGAIIVATESIFSTRIELPEFSTPTGSQEAGGLPGSGELDDKLNESIAIFEGKIIDARNVIIDGTPAPTSSDNIPGVMVLGGGNSTDRETTLKENEGTDGDLNIPEVLEPGMMPSEGREVASSGLPASPNPIPDDVPDAQGDDIVAKQLREAAISETDPKLSAKLWDEYRKYKAGL